MILGKEQYDDKSCISSYEALALLEIHGEIDSSIIEKINKNFDAINNPDETFDPKLMAKARAWAKKHYPTKKDSLTEEKES